MLDSIVLRESNVYLWLFSLHTLREIERECVYVCACLRARNRLLCPSFRIDLSFICRESKRKQQFRLQQEIMVPLQIVLYILSNAITHPNTDYHNGSVQRGECRFLEGGDVLKQQQAKVSL